MFVFATQEGSSTQHRIKSLVKTLQRLTYNYVCRSLFKADRLMFALHMVHGMFPDMFDKNVRLSTEISFNQFLCVLMVFVRTNQEWEAFTGTIVADVKPGSDKDLPQWVEPDRGSALSLLRVRLLYKY